MSQAVRYDEADLWRDGDYEHAMATVTVAKLLSGNFVLIVVVVLMNQLIALMGDSYDRVQENFTVQARISRARVILDMMDLYVPKNDQSVFARWIHVLRPAGDHNNIRQKGAWGGRLKAVKSAVSKSAHDLETHLMRAMTSHLDHIEAKFDKKIDAVLRRMGGNHHTHVDDAVRLRNRHVGARGGKKNAHRTVGEDSARRARRLAVLTS